jgi:iron(III) transport system substrate-binding protein
MLKVRRAPWIAVGYALLLAACSPPLATTPTAASQKPSPTQPAPAAASAPTSAPAPKPAATSGSAVSATDDELGKVRRLYYEAAKPEGKLVIYGGGSPDQFGPVKTAFQQEFPGMTVDSVDQRGRETREKVLVEQQTKNFVADLAITGTDTQASIIEAGATEDYQSVFIDKVVPDLRPQYATSSPYTASNYTIAINTTLVKPEDEPRSWKDVLDPKWKGKLALDDPRGSGPGAYVLAAVEEVLGQDYTTELAKQDVFIATQAGPLWAALLRGERLMFLSSSHRDVITQKQQGAPVKQIRPVEGIVFSPTPQALLRNAPHPNAAKLWIEWSLSKQGQQALADNGYGPVRADVPVKFPEASLDEKLLPRQDTQAAFAGLADRVKRWSSLFQ